MYHSCWRVSTLVIQNGAMLTAQIVDLFETAFHLDRHSPEAPERFTG